MNAWEEHMGNVDFYWNSLQRWQYDLKCAEHTYHREVVISRTIKIITSCVATSAVATWAIWGKYPILWGALIALAQVLSTAYECTPYAKRISELGAAAERLDEIYEAAEEEWLNISDGRYTEDEVLDLRNEYSRKWSIANRGILKEDALRLSGRTASKLQAEAIQHMKNLYGGQYEY